MPTLRILADGRAGHEAQTLGIAETLGFEPDIRRVSPRLLFAALAPFGPSDPRDSAVYAPPYPDIALAAGRRTIPALRRLKRASKGRTFTVYVNAPSTGLHTADLIVAPRHDGLAGANVIAPLTPASRITPALLASLRAAPDPRLDALPRPRVALLVGGDSKHGRYRLRHIAELDHIVGSLLASGHSVMATASRRTPEPVREALRQGLAAPSGFFWDGAGANPYLSMLASADSIVVTGDSVSMVGEAVATGAPVHVVAAPGGHRKIGVYLAALEHYGALRPWRGALERWSYEPLNSTPMIVEAIGAAYAAFRAAPSLHT